jgi:hypothetical protein
LNTDEADLTLALKGGSSDGNSNSITSTITARLL